MKAILEYINTKQDSSDKECYHDQVIEMIWRKWMKNKLLERQSLENDVHIIWDRMHR